MKYFSLLCVSVMSVFAPTLEELTPERRAGLRKMHLEVSECMLSIDPENNISIGTKYSNMNRAKDILSKEDHNEIEYPNEFASMINLIKDFLDNGKINIEVAHPDLPREKMGTCGDVIKLYPQLIDKHFPEDVSKTAKLSFWKRCGSICCS